MTSTSRFKLKLTPRTQLKQKIVPGLPQAGDGTLVKFDVENGVYIPRLDLSGLPLQSAPASGRETDTYLAIYNTSTGDYGLNQYQGLLDAAAAQAEAATLLRTRPVFNVKNYAGIVNDGTSSDQTAITAALADAVAANGVLYFPASANSYRGKIVVPDNTHGLYIVGDGVGSSDLLIVNNNDNAVEINSPTGSGNITNVTVIGMTLRSTGTGIPLKIWNTLFFSIADCDLQALGTVSGAVGLDVQGSQGVFNNVTVHGGAQGAKIGNGGGALTNAGTIVFMGGQIGMNYASGIGGALLIEGDPLCVAFIGTMFQSTGGAGATSTGVVQIDGPSSGTPVGDVSFINCHMESVYNTTNTLAGFELGRNHACGQVRIVSGNYWGHGSVANYAQDFVRCVRAPVNLIVDGVTTSKLSNTHGWSRSFIRHESGATPTKYSYRSNNKGDIDGALYSDADGVLTGETGDATNNSQAITGTIRNTGLGAGFVKSNSSGQFSSASMVAADISDASANGRSLIQAANYAAMKTLLAIAAADITDASANGRSLITAANYAAMRSLLGLVIGTNVQAWDADLDTWATKTAPSGAVVGTSDTQALTNKDLSGTGNAFPTFNQNTTGNAATATKLATARNIDGQAFDGTAAITVIAPGTHAATSKATPVDADELPLVDSAASNVLKKLTWANLKATLPVVVGDSGSGGTKGLVPAPASGDAAAGKFLKADGSWAVVSGGGGATRELLAANRTYYVRTDGSDSNDGLSNTSGGAFLTMQKAANVIGALDISIFNVTVNVAAGTYAESVVYKPPVGSGTVSFIGDETTPSNVVVQRFQRSLPGPDLVVAGFKLNISSSQQIYCAAGTITARNNQYETTTNFNTYAATGGQISFTGTANKINGGSIGMWLCDQHGRMFISNCTFTLLASVTYSGATVTCRQLGYIESVSFTFTLGAFSVTGARYSVSVNGAIATATGANHFPGSSAGTSATGGQYS